MRPQPWWSITRSPTANALRMERLNLFPLLSRKREMSSIANTGGIWNLREPEVWMFVTQAEDIAVDEGCEDFVV